jgi:hypothetical protein
VDHEVKFLGDYGSRWGGSFVKIDSDFELEDQKEI